MNFLDWILMIVIGASSIYGLAKGFVRAVVSILAVIIGLILASRLYSGVSPFLLKFGLGDPVLIKVFSFLTLFGLIFIAVILIAKKIHMFVHVNFSGSLNRVAGLGVGLAKGIIISSCTILILTVALSEKNPVLRQSKFTPHIMNISKILIPFAPEDLKKHFKEKEEKLREFWGGKIPKRLPAGPGTKGLWQLSR
jgi:membrane protein required for colicin V production